MVDSRGGNGNLNKPYRAIVTRDGWKYASFQGVSWMLFNLSEDPYETANLANDGKYRAERRKLISRLKQWVADTKDNFQLPED